MNDWKKLVPRTNNEVIRRTKSMVTFHTLRLAVQKAVWWNALIYLNVKAPCKIKEMFNNAFRKSYILSNKVRVAVSCESSARQTTHMKRHTLFYAKKHLTVVCCYCNCNWRFKGSGIMLRPVNRLINYGVLISHNHIQHFTDVLDSLLSVLVLYFPSSQ